MRRVQTCSILTLVLAALFFSVGCNDRDKVTRPDEYVAPYDQTQKWAVVGFEDQSPDYEVAGDRYAEKVIQTLQETQGVNAVPLADTIAAMRRVGLRQVTNRAEANALMRELKIDGVIAGGITDWNPYEPMKMGMQARLYTSKRRSERDVDPRRITGATSDTQLPSAEQNYGITEVSMFLNAADGRTLNRLKEYARGRTSEDAPEGWRSYLVSMDRYERFAAHEMIRRIFAAEWERLKNQ